MRHNGSNALKAKEICSKLGVDIVVVNMLCIKPKDETILNKMKAIKLWVTAEDGCISGGIGSTLSSFAAEKSGDIKVKHIGIPDNFVPHGSISEIYGICGMTANDIAGAVLEEIL